MSGRDPFIEEQIAAARAAYDLPEPVYVPKLTLVGPELEAYIAVRDAAQLALNAQHVSAKASADLRAAIEAMCRGLAPSPEVK